MTQDSIPEDVLRIFQDKRKEILLLPESQTFFGMVEGLSEFNAGNCIDKFDFRYNSIYWAWDLWKLFAEVVDDFAFAEAWASYIERHNAKKIEKIYSSRRVDIHAKRVASGLYSWREKFALFCLSFCVPLDSNLQSPHYHEVVKFFKGCHDLQAVLTKCVNTKQSRGKNNSLTIALLQQGKIDLDCKACDLFAQWCDELRKGQGKNIENLRSHGIHRREPILLLCGENDLSHPLVLPIEFNELKKKAKRENPRASDDEINNMIKGHERGGIYWEPMLSTNKVDYKVFSNEVDCYIRSILAISNSGIQLVLDKLTKSAKAYAERPQPELEGMPE